MLVSVAGSTPCVLPGERRLPLPRPRLRRAPVSGSRRAGRRLAARRERGGGLWRVAPTLAPPALPRARATVAAAGARHRAGGNERVLLPVDRTPAAEHRRRH